MSKARVRNLLRLTLASAVVMLASFAVIEAMAWVTWSLSTAGDHDFEELAKLPAPDRAPDPGTVSYHEVAIWTGNRDFSQAPSLAERVTRGELPPVDQRLPLDPVMIIPPQQHGPYGGTWHRIATGQADVGSVVQNRICYESWLRWDPLAQELQPNLADLPEIEDEGRAYTFSLRRGVRWSDGAPFTADDVMFWYQHVLLNNELTPSVDQSLQRDTKPVQVTKLDDYTIRFEFAAPQGLFAQQMASEMFAMAMVNHPAHYLRQFHPDTLAEDMARRDPSLTLEDARAQAKARLDQLASERGFTGWYAYYGDKANWRNPDCPRLWAWVLREEPTSGKPVVLYRNPFYWKVDDRGAQLPYIDELSFRIFENKQAILSQAIAGRMSMQGRHIDFVDYAMVMRHAAAQGYHVVHWIDANACKMVLAPNLNHHNPALREIFQDKRFRIALSHAIDRDELNEVGFFGMGKPRQVAPPELSRFADPAYASAHLAYDPARANALLDEMGLEQRDSDGTRLRPDGQPLKIYIELSSATIASGNLELIVDYWTKVGVRTELKNMARQLFYERKSALLHDVGTWGGGDEMNPIFDPRWFLPYSHESIQAIDYARWFISDGRRGTEPTGDIRRCIELYRQIQRTPDQQEQLELFQQIIDLNRENLWVIGTVGEVPFPIVVRNGMRNVPETAVYGWVMKSPSNTAPECYAIDLAKEGD